MTTYQLRHEFDVEKAAFSPRIVMAGDLPRRGDVLTVNGKAFKVVAVVHPIKDAAAGTPEVIVS